MISITPEQDIIRDGVNIGTIRDGVAFTSESVAGVIKGQIKRAAGNPELTFEVVENDPPTVEESSVVAPIPDAGSSVVVAANGKAEALSDVGASATLYDTSGFDCTYEQNPKLFAQCFINTYGPHGYSEWLKQNGK